MNKKITNGLAKVYPHKLLATSIAAVCTGMVATSVTQASDIDIYQEAQSGTITLMFMLDTSTSMYSSSFEAPCDAPVSISSSNRGIHQSATTDRPYSRYYCRPSSGSTTRYYDRITRLKDGMYDLLHGSATVTRLADDLIIGLSDMSGNRTGTSNSGRVMVPARPLDESVTYLKQQYRRVGSATTNYTYAECSVVAPDGICTTWGSNFNPGGSTNATTKSNNFNNMVSGYSTASTGTGASTTVVYSRSITTTHRQLLINAIVNTPADGGIGMTSGTNYTPTATTYADTAAYLMGTTTRTGTNSGFAASSANTKNPSNTNNFLAPQSIRDEMARPTGSKSCSGQGIYVLTDGEPRTQNGNNEANAQALMRQALTDSNYSCSNNTDYLTGGLYTGGWRCISNFAVSLLDQDKNPTGLKMKTAVVGFGSLFDGLPEYNTSLTQAQNLALIDAANITGTAPADIKNTAKWGLYGEGGYYSGSSSQDIVDSVNSFLSALSTEIPSVTTGTPTIPRDALNPAVLQNDAYYQQFQPTPDRPYQLWVGNLKKYLVAATGQLQGKGGSNLVDSQGQLIEPTYSDNGRLLTAVYDYWATAVQSDVEDADENTLGSKKFAARGGVWSQLKLRTDAEDTVQRKLFTNRVATGTGDFIGSNNTLRRVDITDLTDSTYQNDPNRGYLISLLGYAVDAANPPATTTALNTVGTLRQIGAVMHSLPVLVTNAGRITYDSSTKTIGSTPREDYVLFGSTQGLLHVVDAVTGQEKFAFAPHEMVENQKEAFLNYTSTSGGVNNLYYGVDGPWTVHTEYVIDNSGNLTVGTGKGVNQQGKQIAYGGLRMGGRSYYALDLSNITNPSLKLHINPTGTTCSNSNPLACMGQSWSKPSIGYVNWEGTRKLVMFVGGGYDVGYESDTYNQTNNRGAGVYMFSADGADAGTLLWWASANATTSAATTNTGRIGLRDTNMKYSVVSEIRAVDRDGDDLIDHLYFGDLGGQVFRIDLNNKATTLGRFATRSQRILDLNTGIANDKLPRFYDMPGFSLYNHAGEVFAVISIGSGNRSSPLKDYTIGTSDYDYDAVYNIYDKDVARRDLYTTSSLNTQNVTKTGLGAITNANRFSDTTLVAPYASSSGWYYQFNNCTTGVGTDSNCSDYKLQSEKVFGTPLAMNYRLYVSTFDGSKPGLSGDCGAGVKGESFLTTFCLPYGQCNEELEDARLPIGAGIHTATVGNKNNDGGDDDDDDDDGNEGGGNGGDKTAASNYCVSTGGRMALTLTGGVGEGAATQVCLIPQRWYEKISLFK